MLPPDLQAALGEANVTLPNFGRSLLLVDDEPENLAVLEALLEGTCQVHVAGSGAEALEWLGQGNAADLVIADQRMPGMTGVELLSRIAEQSPETIRIVLTAYSDVEPMLDAINRGSVYRFLVKPYEPEELRATVSEGLWVKHHTALLRHLVAALSQRRDELSQALNDLKGAQDQLLASERMATIGQATSGIVHDLRNLSTIVSYVMGEIQARTQDEHVLRSAQQALDGLEGLLNLLEHIREFACAGDTHVSRAPVGMAEFLERTLSLAEMHETARGCPLELEVEPESPTLQLDPARMQQALLALIDNAVLASRPGSPVTIRARRSTPPDGGPVDADGPNAWACVEVIDRGAGMSETVRSQAFQPLFSAFSPPRLGLGLEAARLVVQAHGGLLELESSPGAGTTARVIIPVGATS